jgi:hypothetical protein
MNSNPETDQLAIARGVYKRIRPHIPANIKMCISLERLYILNEITIHTSYMDVFGMEALELGAYLSGNDWIDEIVENIIQNNKEIQPCNTKC